MIAPDLVRSLPELLHRPPSLTSASSTASFAFDGTDLMTLLELVAAGHGLAPLPRRVCALVDGVRTLRVRHPTLANRTELLVLRSAIGRHRTLITALRS